MLSDDPNNDDDDDNKRLAIDLFCRLLFLKSRDVHHNSDGSIFSSSDDDDDDDDDDVSRKHTSAILLKDTRRSVRPLLFLVGCDDCIELVVEVEGVVLLLRIIVVADVRI